MKCLRICCDKTGICCPKCLKYSCPAIYNILYSKKGEYRTLKAVSGILYGLLLGLAFYELIIVDLDFTEYVGLSVGSTVCLALAVGVAVSSQIRCIALLAMPIFGGKTGRAVLKALVFVYIISGPIENLTNNGKEVVRVFACATTLNYNLTKTRFELMFKPFKEALFGMKADMSEVKDTLRSIKDVSAPIVGEVENEEEMKKMKEENDYIDTVQKDSKRSDEIDQKYNTTGEQSEAARFEKMYLKKIEYRCEDQLSRAARKCRGMFQTAYDKCYDTVTFLAAWILCWPMKLTFVCNLVESLGGSKVCDPQQELDPGFGEGYVYLKQARSAMSQNFKDVRLQYKITKIKYLQDVRDAADTAKAVVHTFKIKKEILDLILLVVKRLLALVMLRILINAQSYHDQYLRDLQFDNIFITRYFRKIDARRHAQEKHALLPLKKIERAKLVDPWATKPLKTEREKIFGQTFKLLLEMITATTFVLLDRLFFEALDLVRRHAKIDYTQVGHHDLKLQVKGTGMIASLLRSVVKGFNIKKRVKVVRSNAACLPRPTVTTNYYLLKIYGTYFAVWLLIIGQAYILRLRRVICAYFYPKREKRRVLFLYNETLKRRIGFFRHMRKKVKKQVREYRLEEDLNVCAVLRIRFPRAFKWLCIFSMARRKCIICGEPEPCKPSGIPSDFERCGNPTCYFVHCVECWNDMGRQCLACGPTPESSDAEETDKDKHYD